MALTHINEMLECRDILVFDGPPSAMVGDTRYITLTSHGEKREGYPLPESICFWTEAEAWWNYKAHLRSALDHSGAKQLAWRLKPEHQVDDEGRHSIRSRLALLQTMPRGPLPKTMVGY